METIEKLAELIGEARASCKGLILSARQRDERIALYICTLLRFLIYKIDTTKGVCQL